MVADTTVVNGSSPVVMSYAYTDFGQLESVTYGDSGITETYTYNVNGSLREQNSSVLNMKLRSDRPKLSGTTARYDGYITEVEWHNKLETGSEQNTYSYAYDKWGQLTGNDHFVGTSNAPGGFSESGITYDSNGNILTLQRYESGELCDDFSYNYNGNKLTKLTGGGTFTYDPNGNMKKDGRNSWNYAYNHLNLVSEVSDSSQNPMAHYSYTAGGGKIGVVDRERNGFLYLGSLQFVIENGTARLEGTGFSGGRILAAEGTSGTVYQPIYFITDYLGSVRAAVSGTDVAYNDYYPYGGRWADSAGAATTNRYLYNGKEVQTTGGLNIYDYGSRMYDPVLGRWFNPDPANQFSNPYVFCGNNPVCFVDPDGEFIIAALIVGAVAGAYFGGVKANGTLNPFKWDYKSVDTWRGIGIGGAIGFLAGGIGAGAAAGIGSLFAVQSGAFFGMATGAAGGFAGGFVSGAGMALTLDGGGLWDTLKAGIISGGIGGLGGAILGGASGGINAALNKRNFWDGIDYQASLTDAVAGEGINNPKSEWLVANKRNARLVNDTYGTKISVSGSKIHLSSDEYTKYGVNIGTQNKGNITLVTRQTIRGRSYFDLIDVIRHESTHQLQVLAGMRDIVRMEHGAYFTNILNPATTSTISKVSLILMNDWGVNRYVLWEIISFLYPYGHP